MNPVLIFGGAILALTLLAATRGTHARVHVALNAQTAHELTRPTINYGGNPNRIGAYVYVMESTETCDQDWAGTFLGMENGMARVRDRDTHVVAHVNRDQVYSAS